MTSQEYSISDAKRMKDTLIAQGFKFFKTYDMPVTLINEKNNAVKDLCDWYYTSYYVVYLCYSDFYGDTNTNKITISLVKNNGIGN